MPVHQTSIVGQRFGRLLVIGQLDPELNGSGKKVYKALVRCDCGTEKEVGKAHITRGATLSCGCIRKEVATKTVLSLVTHGESRKDTRSAEYSAWSAMNARCNNPAHHAARHYGGRGIRVCDEWKASYEAFLAYVGRRPSPQHSLDRYPNNDGNYEPGNVRWATKQEQSANRRLPHREKMN